MEPIMFGTMGQRLIPATEGEDDPIAGEHEFCGGSIEVIRVAKCFNSVACRRCGTTSVVFHKITTFRALRAQATAWRLSEHAVLAEARTSAWWQAVMEPLLAGDLNAAKRAALSFPTFPLSPEEQAMRDRVLNESPVMHPVEPEGRHTFERRP